MACLVSKTHRFAVGFALHVLFRYLWKRNEQNWFHAGFLHILFAIFWDDDHLGQDFFSIRGFTVWDADFPMNHPYQPADAKSHGWMFSNLMRWLIGMVEL